MEFQVRAARGEDLREVARIDRETPEAPHWAGAEYALRLDANDEAVVRRCLLVAVRDGVVVGYCAGRVLGDEAELESVAVDVAMRRLGVGRMLCGAVLEWCGAETMDLEVRSRSLGAQRLYAGLGFVERGRRARYYRDPEDDAVMMRWTAGPGAGKSLPVCTV